MIEDNKVIKITNRDNGTIGYSIPDLGNLYRKFEPGETKDVTMDELRKLSWVPGGMYLLKNCLIIRDNEALREILTEVEPEYYYTEKEILELLKTGSMDSFLDCLDFAPDGVIQLIKDLAVKTELNDVAKREAILAKTGFNVTKAIEINKESAEIDAGEDSTKARRATVPAATTEAPQRRSKYNVVSIKE